MWDTLNYLVDSLIVAYTLYFAFFVAVGLYTKKCMKPRDAVKRFAVVVPAHNEQTVLPQLLQNLESLDYPRHLYDIVVVADNCQDRTAVLAREQGAQVLERFSELKGKGYALQYAFEKLGFLSNEADYDAAVVFDADNLVEDNFLKVMNDRLHQGEQIIQSYVDAKNPQDNWVTSTFSMMFWINDRFNLLSRTNIGLSAVLMGTGMCISAEAFTAVGWNTRTLTEDLEYSIQALLKGIKTSFAPETRIYDEKPLSFKASCIQRLRWARGQLAVVQYYVVDLLKKGVRDRSLTALDGGARLFQLPFLMFAGMATVLRLSFPGTFASPLFNWAVETIPMLAVVLPAVPYLLPFIVIVMDRVPRASVKYVVFFPLFMYSWIPILYWALFTLGERSWLPTAHSRAAAKDDLSPRGLYASESYARMNRG